MNGIIRFISALALMFFILMPSVAAEKREWRLEQIHALRGKTVIYFTASELPTGTEKIGGKSKLLKS